MLSVAMFSNNLSIFSGSDLTFYQSWFLRDGKRVFDSATIIFINSTLFFSCVNLFCDVGRCGVSVFIILHFNFIKGFLLFSILHFGSRSGALLVFFPIYLYVLVRKKTTFLWSASLWLLVSNRADSVQISIILFLYPLGVGLLLK